MSSLFAKMGIEDAQVETQVAQTQVAPVQVQATQVQTQLQPTIPEVQVSQLQDDAITDVEVMADDDVVDDSNQDIVSEDAMADAQEVSELHSAMESALSLQATITSMIESKACTPATLRLAVESYKRISRSCGVEPRTLSLESANTIEEQHQLALEGVMDSIKAIGERIKNYVGRKMDTFADLFRVNSAMIAKYEPVIVELETALKNKQHELANGVTLNLGIVKSFLVSDTGLVTDLIPALKNDAQFTRDCGLMALKGAGEQLLHLDRLLADARKNTLESWRHMLDGVCTLRLAEQLIPSKHLGKHYLRNASIGLLESNTSDPITFAGKTYSKIAQLASGRTLRVVYGKKNYGDGSPHVLVNYKALEGLLAAAKEYLSIMKSSIELEKNFDSVADSISGSYYAVGETYNSRNSEMTQNDLYVLQQLYAQIYSIMDKYWVAGMAGWTLMSNAGRSVRSISYLLAQAIRHSKRPVQIQGQ